MTIIYFTATGNSLFVAKAFNEKTYAMVQAVKNQKFTFEDDKIGVVFPVYGLCVPPYVRNFLEQAKFNCQYLFGIITYGVHQGAVVKDLLGMTNGNNRTFDYINTFRTTETCLSKFEMKQEIGKMQDHSFEQDIFNILEDVKQQKHWIRPNSTGEKILTGIHRKMYPYPIGIGMTSKYTVEAACNHCGICTKVCPMDNIALNAGKLSFGKKCISCQACTQNCPVNAIRLSNEKSKERYRNSKITLQEIITANK